MVNSVTLKNEMLHTTARGEKSQFPKLSSGRVPHKFEYFYMVNAKDSFIEMRDYMY